KYVDDQIKKDESYITESTYDEFELLLENDKKNIFDYCEAGKYEKMINMNKLLKEKSNVLHFKRKMICDELRKNLPDKEIFFNNIIENNEDPDLLMYKGFVYNSLRNKDIIDELGIEKIVSLEKKRLESIKKSLSVN